MYPYNTDPYDSQDYESPSLPYIPYSAPGENTAQSYNAPGDALSKEIYPPTPSVYENTPTYAQHVQEMITPPLQQNPTSLSSVEPLVASPLAKKKRRRWLPIGVAVLLLLIIGVSAFALVTYLNRSTPTKTLDTFCTALQNGKYQTAYDQFTPKLQANFTESEFATLLSSDSVATCSHGIANENGTSTTTDLHLYHNKSKGTNNDRVVVTKDSHNQWKINDIQKVS